MGAPSTMETAREGGREGWYGMKVAGMGGISSAASLEDFVKWWFFLSFLFVESDVCASSRRSSIALRSLGCFLGTLNLERVLWSGLSSTGTDFWG